MNLINKWFKKTKEEDKDYILKQFSAVVQRDKSGRLRNFIFINGVKAKEELTIDGLYRVKKKEKNYV